MFKIVKFLLKCLLKFLTYTLVLPGFFIYMNFRGKQKFTELRLLFVNKIWVDLVEIIRTVDFYSDIEALALTYLYCAANKSKAEFKFTFLDNECYYTISEDGAINFKPFVFVNLGNDTVLKLKYLKVNFQFTEEVFTKKTNKLKIEGKDYVEIEVVLNELTPNQNSFIFDFIEVLMEMSGTGTSLKNLGFKVEIFSPYTPRSKKRKVTEPEKSFVTTTCY